MRVMMRPSICTFSRESLGPEGVIGAGNTAWPTSNDAMFVPFNISRPILVKRLFSGNGNVASGNLDMGLYTADGARIVSAGSTAMSGATALQFFDIADTYLSPGRYYMALAVNNTSATFRRMTITSIRQQQWGILKMTTAFALPAIATFATPTSAFVPLMGMDLNGVL
jgi:hypothetical protein